MVQLISNQKAVLSYFSLTNSIQCVASLSDLQPVNPETPQWNSIVVSNVPPDQVQRAIAWWEKIENEHFTAELKTFLCDIGQPMHKLPLLGYRPLNLHRLYREVVARGGMDLVTKRQEWKEVYQSLGLSTMSTSASYNTRTNYKKYLYLYELEHFQSPQEMVCDDASSSQFVKGEQVKMIGADRIPYYGVVLKQKFHESRWSSYIRYNGWPNCHNEWIEEQQMQKLDAAEKQSGARLTNPPPTRSTHSNKIFEANDTSNPPDALTKKKKMAAEEDEKNVQVLTPLIRRAIEGLAGLRHLTDSDGSDGCEFLENVAPASADSCSSTAVILAQLSRPNTPISLYAGSSSESQSEGCEKYPDP